MSNNFEFTGYTPPYAHSLDALGAPMGAPAAASPTHQQPLAAPVEIVGHWPEPSRKERRKASHNAVERRRRDTISEKIRELAAMVPADFDLDETHMSPLDKQPKSVVLQRSIDYMRHLQETQYLLQQRLALMDIQVKRE